MLGVVPVGDSGTPKGSLKHDAEEGRERGRRKRRDKREVHILSTIARVGRGIAR